MGRRRTLERVGSVGRDHLRVHEVDLRDLLVVDPLELLDHLLTLVAIERLLLLLVELVELGVGLAAVAPAQAFELLYTDMLKSGSGSPPHPQM